MNSTMGSLSFGVPLIVIPHINEQKLTAQRVQELGLGLALDEACVTAQVLQEAVLRITREPVFWQRAEAMRDPIRVAGGYRRAADALQTYVESGLNRCVGRQRQQYFKYASLLGVCKP
jgi:UDP:flavonoid glycosyltransferase YjiC (YdhE family)